MESLKILVEKLAPNKHSNKVRLKCDEIKVVILNNTVFRIFLFNIFCILLCFKNHNNNSWQNI